MDFWCKPGDVKEAARYAIEILSRADRGREMGKTARLNAKKKILRQRRHPRLRVLLQARPQRILMESG